MSRPLVSVPSQFTPLGATGGRSLLKSSTESAACGFSVRTDQLPGWRKSASMVGSVHCVGVEKSPPRVFSSGLLNIGANHWPPTLATMGLSFDNSSAKLASSSSATKTHSDAVPSRLLLKRAQAR